jgi:glycosyltransferase involved in cell wall biosynthesis
MDKVEQRPPRLVQLQTVMSSAGSFALRLHRVLQDEGMDCSIVSCMPDRIKDEKIVYLPKKSRMISRLDSKLKGYINRNNKKEYGAFSYPVLGSDIAHHEAIRNADVIYLHWVLNGFLNLNNIEQLIRLQKPVVFFLHDMWAITGGCHHSFSCEKYMTACGRCPILPGNRENDLSAREFRKKIKLYSKYSNIYFVSPSTWMYDCAKKSALTRDKPIFHIPNILDDKVFKPVSKAVARQLLNIDAEETVIAFGAMALDSPYKGMRYLLEALQHLHQQGLQNISVLVFGGGNKPSEQGIPFKTRSLGYLSDEYSMSLVYNAADVFVVPSLAESFGYVILEALSCGTPVVGFDVGGIPDLIKHKENGYLARYKDAGDLAYGIRFCIENKVSGKRPGTMERNAVVEMHTTLIDQLVRKS